MVAIREVPFITHVHALYQTLVPFSVCTRAQLGIFQKTAIPAQFRVHWLQSKFQTSEWSESLDFLRVDGYTQGKSCMSACARHIFHFLLQSTQTNFIHLFFLKERKFLHLTQHQKASFLWCRVFGLCIAGKPQCICITTSLFLNRFFTCELLCMSSFLALPTFI